MTAAQPDYAWQKTYQAVRILAASPKNLRERLSDAWWHQMNSLVGSPIPWDDLRGKFEKIQSELVPEISERAEAQTKLSEQELGTIAAEIVDLHDQVCKRNT
jgi:hypothetical protein